ncbi:MULTISPECIES: CDP-glycerol glycerophosphotransferase family protein [Heyndrickxia]|uniref:CDP-glycerol glycerophosphotransferase family protein n=1 Tax=Heyndrickxia TaxID=2837504 RepID=UPI002E1E7089|nr:CDP-glycerol glycerophosphotransferase family protein [Weizmannia sp. CD-2023]MED4322572.1 CDP-glycerol glycerophosphotransferase family protein [Weizmannia sp. CD-2023]MED4866960.1 CDP-glycerol glycerophosphotransferase family protein [Weizmannia sp. CD-2023]MED4890495.1 CDP-glycerol glycerophosphotransferase family protein [Weizmannia sp. CD-2023]MED4921642.1 CDP-glycerol glycerophosphotransferase family protein [Weizmannia sp. CD-2023]
MKKMHYLFNAVLALMLMPIYKKKLLKKRLLLVGGHKGDLFTDNGKEFFIFLCEQYPEEYITYWVINSNSKDLRKVKKYNYLIRGSIKNYIYYFFSRGVFFTHSIQDVAPIISAFIKPKGKRVFLSHGIEGLKKLKLPRLNIPQNKKADLYLSISAFEKNIKVNDWNIDESKVKITGYPRYDKLIKRDKYEKVILYAPTWREWNKGLTKEQFRKTDYYREVMNFLQSDDLQNMLRKNGYQLYFYVHYLFHQFADTFNIKSDYIKLLEPNDELQKYILNSEIFITDYSSSCWDFFYLDKPVLFYMFDQKKYEEKRGSYIDLDGQLIGEKYTSLNNLLSGISEVIRDRETYSNRFYFLKEKYYKFNDTNNCQRVLDEFKKLEVK